MFCNNIEYSIRIGIFDNFVDISKLNIRNKIYFAKDHINPVQFEKLIAKEEYY